MQKYNKFIVALFGIIITLVAPHFGGNQTLQWITGVVTMLGVFHIPNAKAEAVLQDAQAIAEDAAAAASNAGQVSQ